MAFSLVTTCVTSDSFIIIRSFSVGLELRSLEHKFILIGHTDLKSLQNYLKPNAKRCLIGRRRGNKIVLFSPYEIPEELFKYEVTVFTEI